MPDADQDGYLHHSAPHPITLPDQPEWAAGARRGLVADVVARVELPVTEPSGAADAVLVIATRADLDATLDALRQAADTLEGWRGLLPE